MRRLLYLALLPLLFASLSDILFQRGFIGRADRAALKVMDNIAGERLPSEGLTSEMTFVCLSGCALDGLEDVHFRLESERILLLTGRPAGKEYVYYRKIV